GSLQTAWKKAKGYLTFEYPVKESDRGGFSWEGIFIRDNRMYKMNRTFIVPWSNKELSITTSTFRDKMLPGSEQTWELTVKGPQKEKVSAELLATMYDASLDAYKKHSFQTLSLYSAGRPLFGFDARDCFQTAQGVLIGTPTAKVIQPYDKRYNSLLTWGLLDGGFYAFSPRGGRGRVMAMAESDAAPVMKSVKMKAGREDLGAVDDVAAAAPVNEIKQLKDSSEAPSEKSESTTNSIRSNFAETAFFFPQLHTDEAGNIIFSFKAPDALTRWKMLAFAHTSQLQTGLLEAYSVTQKELMIVPQTPRFLREGDAIMYSAKVTNLSDKELKVASQISILDAIDMTSVDVLFLNEHATQDIIIPKGESRPVSWQFKVPKGFTHPVIIKTIASSGQYSDGEQNVLPVLLNSMLVTETMPLPVRVNSSKTFSMANLLGSKNSSTLRHYGLTVEYTGNPAWYAIQSLPYLTDYPYECAEQTFNRYYANVLATHVANAYPSVKKVFAQWKDKDSAALLSNLSKNQELKNALLKETPWVMDANSEHEQKKAIANLFDMVRMSRELENTTRELEMMQTPNGGFAWFKGMPDDRFMTQYILTGIGRLLHLGISEVNQDSRLIAIVERALPYLDQRIKEDYQYLLKHKANLKLAQISTLQIHYLYMRSYFLQHEISSECKTAFQFYKKQAADFWLQHNKQSQAMISLVMERDQNHTKASAILQSLRENAIRSEEMGMYWKDNRQSYWWYEAPVETQSILVEAFQEVGGSNFEVDELKIWLLKNKQTQHWSTTKATADACYALLLQGNDWLVQEPTVNIQLGDQRISSLTEKKEAGTGYFKHHIKGAEVNAAMGQIKVDVDGKGVGTSWGAVYWQYFEDLDKIKFAETPLSVRKELYVERNSAQGPVLTKVSEQMSLHVGDKLKARIELRVDRDMEYVHLKDMRASCLEPTNVLSQYKYQGGLGYYESTKDASTSFFFHWLPKGTYVFEYPMMVTNKGDFSNGIATIQCMYAPEFSSHSNGIRLQVK
nr:alpha-2-macroglobulin family protein [Chitinophagaceae bacterium]